MTSTDWSVLVDGLGLLALIPIVRWVRASIKADRFESELRRQQRMRRCG